MQKQKEFLPEAIKELPPAPDDVVEWIQKTCVSNTCLIYSQKKKTAVCSRCGNRIPLKRMQQPVRHNTEAVCPVCGIKGTCKAEGIGREGVTERFRVMLIVQNQQAVWITVSDVNAVFREAGLPEIERRLRQIIRLTEQEQSHYFYSLPWSWDGGGWEERKKVYLYTPARGDCYSPAKYEAIYLYDKNLDALNEGPLQYAEIKKMRQKWSLTAKEVLAYIMLCLKYPKAELLRKFGCKQLLIDYITGNGNKSAVYWKGTSIPKMLRCNMAQAREIRNRDIGLSELRYWQRLKKEYPQLSIAAAALLLQDYEVRQKEIASESEVKIAEYLARQNDLYHRQSRMRDYEDYHRDCEMLGYDWNRKRNQWPLQFETTHQEYANKVQERKKEISTATYKKAIEAIQGSVMATYKEARYCILLPQTPEAIRSEGKAQQHCVGGYVQKILDHRCYILFLRRTEAPEEPFYTVEVTPEGALRQCRGRQNRSMAEDVKAFVERWQAAIRSEQEKRKRQKQKGA